MMPFCAEERFPVLVVDFKFGLKTMIFCHGGHVSFWHDEIMLIILGAIKHCKIAFSQQRLSGNETNQPYSSDCKVQETWNRAENSESGVTTSDVCDGLFRLLDLSAAK